MSAPSPASPARPVSLAAAAVVAVVLATFELIVTLAVPDSGVNWRFETYTPALFAITILVLGLHGVALLAVDRGVERLPGRARPIYWGLLAAAFGVAWQDSVMHGDGIRAFAYYDAVRVVGALAGAVGLSAWCWAIGFWTRLGIWWRRAAAALAVLGGAAVTQTVLLSYDTFHGYLVMFTAANATWLLAPLLRARASNVIGWLMLAASAAAVVVTPQWESGQRAVQRFTEIPAALLALPWTAPLQLQPESVLNPDADLTSAQLAAFRRGFTQWRDELTEEVHGSNVLLIVLESTRADSWADPAIAPRFHQWKKHGLYIPRAVAQYPATPLAYGAMFTSQPPSVLTQTPAWARSRLFDRLAPRFDHVILSRPKNPWFDKEAITDFFVPKDVPVMQHTSAGGGLNNLRREIGKLKPDESFFAWVHLYEPHQPWVKRPKYAREGKGDRIAYESEVGFVDFYLGSFMEWFFAQPAAAETLVIVIADHGEALGERVHGKPFWGHHVHVRNVVSHIPAFIAAPGLPRGETATDIPVAQLDVMPTMFDFVGEELPLQTYAQGRSIFALIEERAPRDLITEAFSIRGKEFFEFVQTVNDMEPAEARKRFQEINSGGSYAPKIALQYGRHKVIRDLLLFETELFDIEADPGEQHNLAETNPELRDELEQRLEAWRRQQGWVVGQLEAR